MDGLLHIQTNDTMLKDAAGFSGEDDINSPVSASKRTGYEIDGIVDMDEGAETRAQSRWKMASFRLRGRSKRRSSTAGLKVYKRRWIGLVQLVLLNIVVSWDWLTFAPISSDAANYLDVTESDINWLSTAFLFSFAVTCPLTIYLLHRGPKPALIAGSILLLLGNWVRYAATQIDGGKYSIVMVGQILCGLSQPFVLAAPTRYSDLWFTEKGRIGATALASMASPVGGAIANLINPALGDVDQVVLIIAVITTAACLPSAFIPANPPTPPTASSTVSKTPVFNSLRVMFSSPPFYLAFITFSVYVGLFNAFSSLLNQIFYPYGYTEDEAGICGAVLIVVGLIGCAIISPIIDRTHNYLLGVKIFVPLITASYIVLAFSPQTRTIVMPYVISGVLGAASFSLLPVALEYLVEITFPASPEVSSTICWLGGQILGGIFIVIMDALKDVRRVDLKEVRDAGRDNATGGDMPPGHMFWGLVFQAAVALAVLPLPMALGVKRLGMQVTEGRLSRDRTAEGVLVGQEADRDVER
ncbi:major facilitator superfamily transporter [Pyrenophora seminiperda CCB06]|uniref:Major facilitator superfamily transporter n=1 Tax=Pyrenophora seminiperda CCB06 TaxID=1302712 RepID=A0A3M7MJH8_9PLEO|nr:major facilitator superfamily transporter [Pyrenophora seminiperda CCB06]